MWKTVTRFSLMIILMTAVAAHAQDVTTSGARGEKTGSFTNGKVNGPLVYAAHIIDDDNGGNSSGNGDSQVNPGEIIELFVDLVNQGTDSATVVNLTLSEDSPFINGLLFNNTSEYPNIAAGEAGRNLDDFCFQLDQNAPNGHVITFSLEATSAEGGPWSSSFQVVVVGPGNAGPLAYVSHFIDDDNAGNSNGNGDGILNPGETAEIFIDLLNQGPDTATEVGAILSEDSPYINGFLFNDTSDYPDIPGGEIRRNNDDWCFFIDPGAPDGHVVTFTIVDSSAEGGPWTESFSLTIVGPGNAGPLVYSAHLIDDDNRQNSNGNGDGIVNGGETIELFVDLLNQGPDPASNVNVTITEDSPYIVDFLFNNTSGYPDIPGGAMAQNLNDFCFYMDPLVPDGHVINFTIISSAEQGGPWSSNFSITVSNVGVPGILQLVDFVIDDDVSDASNGNDDGIVNSGETIELSVALENLGSGAASGVGAVISEDSPFINGFISSDSTGYPDIPGGGQATGNNDFVFLVDPATPDGHVVNFTVAASGTHGGPWTSNFSVTVSEAPSGTGSSICLTSAASLIPGDVGTELDLAIVLGSPNPIAPPEDLQILSFDISWDKPDLLGFDSAVAGGFFNGSPSVSLNSNASSVQVSMSQGTGEVGSGTALDVKLVVEESPENPDTVKISLSNIIALQSNGAVLVLENCGPIEVAVNSTNNPVAPTIAAISDTLIPEGAPACIPVIASDGNGDVLTIRTENLPAFGDYISTGNGTGMINLEPTFNDAGSYGPVLVIVEDPSGLSDSTSFFVAVRNINRQPIIDVIDDRVMQENDTLEFTVSAFDPDGDALTLTAANLPPFAQFIDNGSGSGTFSAQPGFADAGFYDNITIIATEASGSVNEVFSLSVNNLNRAPSIVAIPDQNIDEGARRIVEVIASDPDSDPLDVALSNQPAFVQLFDSSNGNRYIEIAPGADDEGIYSINVTATDPFSASVTDTFEVQVANVLGLTDLNGSLPTDFVLQQNYPNPFNPSTTIAFGIPQSGSVKIVVYNSVGQKVGVVLEERLEAGYYKKTFSADNLPSGVYLYRMEAEGFQDIKKFVLLK